jgi:hypothetical protein
LLPWWLAGHVEDIILPKFYLQLKNINGSNLGINIDKRKHQWIFFTMPGHLKCLQAENGMYVEDNHMNQHHLIQCNTTQGFVTTKEWI